MTKEEIKAKGLILLATAALEYNNGFITESEFLDIINVMNSVTDILKQIKRISAQ